MEKDTPMTPPQSDTEETIRALLHEAHIALGALDTLVGRVEHIQLKLKDLLRTGRFKPDGPPPWREDPIAYNVEFERRPDGHAVISIDGGKEVTLAPQLAEVFAFIASGSKEGDRRDSLVGWRSRTEILGLVTHLAGRSFKSCYANHLVHRLKTVLASAGYNRKLIQTHRHKGVRLAYKRGSSGGPAADYGTAQPAESATE